MKLQDLIEKYGDRDLTFVGYYKFQFTYEGVLADGSKLRAILGDEDGDIYRDGFDLVETLKSGGHIFCAYIDGNIIYED